MGWDDDVSCTCTHVRCYATDGVVGGWGGDDDVSCTCTHVRCYATDGVGTQSCKNKDLMLWMRCWQWRYEHGSDDLLKATGHKLNNL